MALDVVALGEPMFELSEVQRDGATVYLPGFGGDTANVAVAAARQGARVGMLTRLGRDAFGDRFLELWRTEGIDTRWVERDEAAATGIYLISYGPQGHAFTYFREGSAASRMTPAWIPRQAIAQAKVLHLSGISQAISESACDACFAAVEAARAAGTLVSYDTNLRLKLWPLPRARAIMLSTIAASDYCLPSLDDAMQLTGLEDPDAIVDSLLEAGARVVALKLGARGALVADGSQRERIAGLEVAAVDATGAGDTFDGAFLACVAGGASPVEAARYANAAAALSTRGHGAVAPMPRRPEVEAFLAESGAGR